MDSTIGILTKGYGYFSKKFEEKDADVYRTRLFLQKTIVMRGADAAKIFYNQQKFMRKGATPKRFQRTLFGEGGVQGLDGSSHVHRKALFMNEMHEESLQRMETIYKKYWMQSLPEWEKAGKIVLFDEAEKVLMRSACEWTGVPLAENEVEQRTRQLSAMIDGSGGIGMRFYRGKSARNRTEEWIGKLIESTRKQGQEISEDSIFHRFCFHRDLDKNLLDTHTVAVEILNLLRPIVAIARYVVFEALALYDHPEYRRQISDSDGEFIHFFVQEVRRLYPFFPFVAAITKEDFTWQNIHFPESRRVLLDLYATNHDPHLWENPEEFQPERFRGRDVSAWELVPQGGGDHNHNHRCAGEWMTIRIMELSLSLLVNNMTYEVPQQNLKINMSRIPAIPHSRFVISNIVRNE